MSTLDDDISVYSTCAVARADPSPKEAFGDQRLFCVEFARSPHGHMGLFHR